MAKQHPLKPLTNLQTLDLHNTQVADLRPLERLINLQTLDLRGAQVADEFRADAVRFLLHATVDSTTLAIDRSRRPTTREPS